MKRFLFERGTGWLPGLPLLLLLLSMCVALAGCAGVTPLSSPAPTLFADARFAAPTEAIGADDLFTLSPAMRDYLHSPGFQQRLRLQGSRHGLVDALYSKSDLKLEYDSTHTRTASETYAARVGNCLSLVLMTAAFAKELGMAVHYRSVDTDQLWSRSNGLYLASAHINIGLSPTTLDVWRGHDPQQVLIVDFIAREKAAQLRSRSLEENDVVALYLNNRAAEALVRNQVDNAYWWARAAVSLRPRSAVALNTLGVIYGRHGDLALSEQAFQAGLAQEPENLTLLRNLQPLLAQLGRLPEAEALGKRIAAIEPVPPYHYFDRGMAAMQAGRNSEAAALFEREVKRAPYNDEFRFWLGVAYLRLGKLNDARTSIALAVDHSTQREMREVYSAKLAYLRQVASGRTHIR